MILTKSQQQRFWREWASACSTQGWTKSDGYTDFQITNERHSMLQRAGFQSLTAVDRGPGFDRVLAELGRLRENVSRTIEVGNSDPGYRRRLTWLVRKNGAALGGEPYIYGLARDKFHLTEGLNSLDDLTLNQLHQLMITLNARCQARRKAGAAASLDSEEGWSDRVGFQPESETADCPF
jgi:hypothetical protein